MQSSIPKQQKKNNSQRISIRLSPQTRKAINELAVKSNCTKTKLIKQLLKLGLKRAGY